MPISRRQYATLADVAEYSNVTVTDDDEGVDQLSRAEEMIDAYVGPQDKHIRQEAIGQATGGSVTKLIDASSDSPLISPEDGYYEFTQVEIVKGTNKGERRTVTDYDQDTSTLTVSPAFSSAIDTTSIYVIKQLGKFPRFKDVQSLDTIYYKLIPEAVRKAVLAQLEYMIEQGTDFFSGATDLQSESVGKDYAYTVRKNANRMIAPAARKLLRGIINRTGVIS